MTRAALPIEKGARGELIEKGAPREPGPIWSPASIAGMVDMAGLASMEETCALAARRGENKLSGVLKAMSRPTDLACLKKLRCSMDETVSPMA